MKNGLLIFTLLWLASCTAPRSIIESGQTTPKGHVKLGYTNTTNVPSAFAKSIYDGVQSGIELYQDQDTIQWNEHFNDLSKAMMSYSIDPLTNLSEFYVRYGILKNWDFGVKYAGVWAFDTQVQFLGIDDDSQGLDASVGLQYSTKSYDFPSVIGDLQQFLGYSMSRHDILSKLMFSKSLGKNEEYGHIGFGLAYNRSFLTYAFDPEKIITVFNVDLQAADFITVPERNNSYGSFGGFINFKVGYKYAYLVGGFSAYHQEYGKYYLFNKQVIDPIGWTFIPSIGAQFAF